jgi:HSP20 family protein
MKTLTKREETTTEAAHRVHWVVPPVNIWDTADGYILEAEMPGVTKDGLEVTVENNELTVLGRRSDTAPPGEVCYKESRPADFRRVFDLDPSIDTGHIVARIEQGVLRLTLPKTERVKPRKISVTG